MVYLYPNYPSNDSISLCLSVSDDISIKKSVEFVDLVGNFYDTPYQNKGFGRLLVNTGIQVLYAWFGMSMNDLSANNIKVTGRTSPEHDPDDEQGRLEAIKRRAYFWDSFGFVLKRPEDPITPMRATLADLKMVDGENTSNGTPRIVKLDEFWLKGEAPELLKYDVDALMQINIEQFDLQKIPQINDIIDERENFDEWGMAISKVTFVLLAAFSVLISIRLFYDDFQKLLTFLAVFVFLSFVVTPFIKDWLLKKLPVYKKYQQLREQKDQLEKNVKDYIEQVENKFNGLFWRIHEPLKDMDDYFSSDVFNSLSDASKNQNPYRLSQYYREYYDFIITAKQTIKDYGYGR